MKSFHYLTGKVIIGNKKENFNIDIIEEVILENISNLIKNYLKIEEKEFEKNKINIEIEEFESIQGFNSDLRQIVFRIEKKVDLFTKMLFNNISNKQILIDTLDSRIDDKGDLFIRFDLKEFVDKQKLNIVDHGDCIHFKIKIASFPKNKENSIKVVENFISDIEKNE